MFVLTRVHSGHQYNVQMGKKHQILLCFSSSTDKHLFPSSRHPFSHPSLILCIIPLCIHSFILVCPQACAFLPLSPSLRFPHGRGVLAQTLLHMWDSLTWKSLKRCERTPAELQLVHYSSTCQVSWMQAWRNGWLHHNCPIPNQNSWNHKRDSSKTINFHVWVISLNYSQYKTLPYFTNTSLPSR